MRLKVRSAPQRREFLISGAFTGADEDAFYPVFVQARRQAEPKIVFNLTGCPFVDDAAAGMLLVVRNEAAVRGISCSIRGASPAVKKFLTERKFSDFYLFC